jgi:hypothetical protein
MGGGVDVTSDNSPDAIESVRAGKLRPKRLSIEWVALPVGLLLSFPAMAEDSSFPARLLGKSVVLRWSADRQELSEGGGDISRRSWRSELNIYISGQGRAFSKEQHFMNDGHQSAAAQAPDESRNSWGGNRTVHFQDGELLVDSLLVAGARHIVINFDAGYDKCSARVIYGREGGAGSIRQRHKSSGGSFEVVSIYNSIPSCSIISGNVFGRE